MTLALRGTAHRFPPVLACTNDGRAMRSDCNLELKARLRPSKYPTKYVREYRQRCHQLRPELRSELRERLDAALHDEMLSKLLAQLHHKTLATLFGSFLGEKCR